MLFFVAIAMISAVSFAKTNAHKGEAIYVEEIIETMVQIPGKDYLIGKYEVTQAQWQAIMGNNPSRFKGDLSRPVERVSWNDCQEFIKKLNARTEVKSAGITFRLPTEEEWEYACRAGSTGKYGLLADGREGTLDEMGWYISNSKHVTHPAGQKKPNAWGLYDMHGNVEEWTASEDNGYHFYRGGSLFSYAGNCEADDRSSNSPAYWFDGVPFVRFYDLGFRLAASRTAQILETEHKAPMKTEVELKVSKKAEGEREIFVAGIEMVRILDNATHKGLYFGKYEVTQAQWQAIMGNNPSYFTGDSSRPVECVSWNDCQEFIKKLNAHTEVKQAGIIFRLPTEAEWEYACRAGSTGKYGLLANGREGSLDEMGWYEDNSGNKTHPVGQKKPNAWGLYDMHGNVCEWTASASAIGSCRIYRGGSYYYGASGCESDSRDWHYPDRRNNILGIRLVASRTGK